jgi:spermidine synthase
MMALFVIAVLAHAHMRRTEMESTVFSASAERQKLRRERVRSCPDDEVLCRVGPQGSHQETVTVCMNAEENTRVLLFAKDVFSEQTAVQCAGKADAGCLTSGHCGACPCEPNGVLSDPYMDLMVGAVEDKCKAAPSIRVLIVGLGGGSMVTRLLKGCPRAELETVDNDPRVVDVAGRFFGVPNAGRSMIETSDASAAAAARAAAGKTYDAILVDCFAGDLRIPLACRSAQFLDSLRRITAPGGQVIQQVWAEDSADLPTLYRARFGNLTISDLDAGEQVLYASNPKQ